MWTDKILDLFMFREGGPEDSDTNEPVVTTGSVVWGLLLRSTIILFAFYYLSERYGSPDFWWLLILVLWFFAAFPAYRQYTKFNKRIEEFSATTLCGSCKYFDKTGQRCIVLDEHVSSTYVPCEGLKWEPTTFEGDDDN